jgi:hypothetical protein
MKNVTNDGLYSLRRRQQSQSDEDISNGLLLQELMVYGDNHSELFNAAESGDLDKFNLLVDSATHNDLK